MKKMMLTNCGRSLPLSLSLSLLLQIEMEYKVKERRRQENRMTNEEKNKKYKTQRLEVERKLISVYFSKHKYHEPMS